MLLGDIAITPDAILRWYHRLVAQKWDYSQRRQVFRLLTDNQQRFNESFQVSRIAIATILAA
jgi:hypothetical protein